MFSLTDPQRAALATARARQQDGERRFDYWSRRETMQAATDAFARTLAASGLHAGRLTGTARAELLHLAAALAPNPALSRRLYAQDPAAFDRRLAVLLTGDAPLVERVGQFVAVPGAGAFTAAQLLCASAPGEFPLVTRAALRRLRLSAAQKRAALDAAAALYDFPLPAATADPAQALLALFVVYEEVRRTLGAASFPEVDDLLKGEGVWLPPQRPPRPNSGEPEKTALTPSPSPALADPEGRSGRGEPGNLISNPRPLAGEGGIPMPGEGGSSPAPQGWHKQAAAAVREPSAPYAADTDAMPAPALTETALLAALEEYALAQGFVFPPHLLRAYYIALQTKPFAILSGVSGSGKTKMAELFAEMLTGLAPAQFRLLAVRPDWTDSTALFGYQNVLANRYVATPFLDMARDAARPEHRQRAFFVCLDEMNLARVEYYLADYLSALESRAHRVPLHEGTPDFALPPNLFVTGTVNVDETTYAFSRKVLDRANTLDFDAAAPALGSAGGGKGAFPAPGEELALPAERQQVFLLARVGGVGRARERLSQMGATFPERAVAALQEVNGLLHTHSLHFAFRVRDDVLMFLANSFDAYTGAGLLVPESTDNFALALDLQMCQKVLPRLSGAADTLASLLADLRRWAEEWPLPRTAARLARMQAHAAQSGYVRFYE